MTKTVYIKLKRYIVNGDTVYGVDSLRNAARVAVMVTGLNLKFFRVGDYVTPAEADDLCTTPRYDVTINN